MALLSLAFWGGFVHAAQTLNVTNHSMAIGITPYGMPISKIAWGGLAYDFSTEDEEAYVWIYNITLDERTTITAQWRFPNGSIYIVNEKTLD